MIPVRLAQGFALGLFGLALEAWAPLRKLSLPPFGSAAVAPLLLLYADTGQAQRPA